MKRTHSILTTVGLAAIACAPAAAKLDRGFTLDLRSAVENGAATAPATPTLDEVITSREAVAQAVELEPTDTPSLEIDIASEGDALAAIAIDAEPELDDLLGPWLSLRFDRPTILRDGGIGGERASLSAEDAATQPLAGYAEKDAEFDLYDLQIQLDTVDRGPLQISIIGGIKAVMAEVGQVSTAGDGTQALRDGRGVVAVPILGGGVRYDVNDRFYFSSSAVAQPYAGSTSMLDITAETGFDIAPGVGLRAGYQLIQSQFEVQSLQTQIDQQGIFARLVIEF